MRRRRLFGDRQVREHGDPSGLAVAERAHERRKVKPAVRSPRHSLRIDLVLQGDGHGAADHIAGLLTRHPNVLSIGYTLTEIEGADAP